MNFPRLGVFSLFVSLVLPVVACATSVTGGGTEDPTSDGDAGSATATPDAQTSPTNDPPDAADAGPELKLGSDTKVTPSCTVSGRYTEAAKDGYNSGFYAIKITPTTYPFHAESISYDLKNGTVISNSGTTYCDSNVAHKLGFFKAPAGAPATTPTDIQIWNATGSGASRNEAIPKPVVLEQGEVGYVLIQMVNDDSATCVYACSTGATAGAHYRAKSVAAPFAWTSYSPSGNMLVSLQGRPVLK